MTLANSEQSRLLPWYAKAGAASSIVPLSRWVSPMVFALKNGGYGVAASVVGMDEESLTDQELESRTRTIQGALLEHPRVLAFTSTAAFYPATRFQGSRPMAIPSSIHS